MGQREHIWLVLMNKLIKKKRYMTTQQKHLHVGTSEQLFSWRHIKPSKRFIINMSPPNMLFYEVTHNKNWQAAEWWAGFNISTQQQKHLVECCQAETLRNSDVFQLTQAVRFGWENKVNPGESPEIVTEIEPQGALRQKTSNNIQKLLSFFTS